MKKVRVLANHTDFLLIFLYIRTQWQEEEENKMNTMCHLFTIQLVYWQINFLDWNVITWCENLCLKQTMFRLKCLNVQSNGDDKTTKFGIDHDELQFLQEFLKK